jgi:hypothetical protein
MAGVLILKRFNLTITQQVIIISSRKRDTRGGRMILFKTVIFSILVPGTVVGLVPYFLLTRIAVFFPIAFGPIRYSGIIPMITGLVFYIASAKGLLSKEKVRRLR